MVLVKSNHGCMYDFLLSPKPQSCVGYEQVRLYILCTICVLAAINKFTIGMAGIHSRNWFKIIESVPQHPVQVSCVGRQNHS